MKYKYLLLACLLLCASCTITKRKYLPGYTFGHVNKAPKTIYNNPVAASPANIKSVLPKALAAKEFHSPVNTITAENPIPDFNDITTPAVYNKNFSSTKIESATESPTLDFSKPGPEISRDSLRAMAARVCKQAKASQHLGMFALTLTLISFAAWVIIQASINAGATWATVMLATTVVSGGVIAGGILAILAIIFAIVAFHKIHLEQGKYTGTGKAVGGIIFAIILFGIVGLLALNIHR